MADRWWTLAAACAWLAFCAAAFGMPVLRTAPGDAAFGRALALQIGSVIFGVALLASLLFQGERPRWPAWSRWLFFAVGLGATIALWQLNLKGPWPMAVHALALCALALPLGWWIGSQMERVTHLIPLGIAMSMADIFSVAQGPSKDIAQRIGNFQHELASKANEAAQGLPPEAAAQAAAEAVRQAKAPLVTYLVAHIPMAGTGGTSPLLGIGDFIALAFIFRAAWVHRLNPALVFGTALGSTFAALALAQLTGIPIPALPVICLGTLGTLFVVEPRLRRLDRQEILLSAGVFLLFAALIAARWVNAG